MTTARSTLTSTEAPLPGVVVVDVEAEAVMVVAAVSMGSTACFRLHRRPNNWPPPPPPPQEQYQQQEGQQHQEWHQLQEEGQRSWEPLALRRAVTTTISQVSQGGR